METNILQIQKNILDGAYDSPVLDAIVIDRLMQAELSSLREVVPQHAPPGAAVRVFVRDEAGEWDRTNTADRFD